MVNKMNNKLKITLIVLAPIVIVVSIFLIMIIGEKTNDKKFEKEILEEYSDIDFEVPKEFEKSGRFHSYYYYKDGISCRFAVDSSEIYQEDFERWFKSRLIVNLNDEVGDLKEIEINGNKAFFVEVRSNDSVEHHYALRSSKYYYSIEYTISNYDKEENPEHICYVSEDKILSSIKIKE